MDLMSNEICPEVSCFEDDDDDDIKLGLIDSWGTKFNIRTSSGGSRDKEFEGEDKQTKSHNIRSKARSASMALRCVFKKKSRKRAGTVGCAARESIDL